MNVLPRLQAGLSSPLFDELRTERLCSKLLLLERNADRICLLMHRGILQRERQETESGARSPCRADALDTVGVDPLSSVCQILLGSFSRSCCRAAPHRCG